MVNESEITVPRALEVIDHAYWHLYSRPTMTTSDQDATLYLIRAEARILDEQAAKLTDALELEVGC